MVGFVYLSPNLSPFVRSVRRLSLFYTPEMTKAPFGAQIHSYSELVIAFTVASYRVLVVLKA